MEEFIVIGLCLAFNAFFAAYEMAFVSVPKPELRRLARTGIKEAQTLLALRENPERTLSIIQIGISLVSALAAAVGGAGAAESIQPYFMKQWSMGEVSAEILSVVLVVVPLTYLSVVAGELVPKSLALRNPVKIVLAGAKWLFIADRILAPAVNVLEWSTKRILKVFFRRSKIPHGPPQTTVEIDALSPTHQQAILNLAHIERRQIKDILVPWKDVTCVRSADSMEDVVPMIFASGHTRIPVTNNGSVAGVLHTKEFLAFRENGGRDWQSIIRSTLKIQAADTALPVLRLMQGKRNHMAVVYSPTGERLGIVTLEDISEEIFGDIFDEDEDSRIRQVFADRVKSKGMPKQEPGK